MLTYRAVSVTCPLVRPLCVCSVDVYEGHPFSVEAAVSLGGAKAKPGVSVYRYANRIPLLFEGSNDVVSVVANTKIKSDACRGTCLDAASLV